MNRINASFWGQTVIFLFVSISVAFIPQFHLNFVIGHLKPTGLRILNLMPFAVMCVLLLAFLVTKSTNTASTVGGWKRTFSAFAFATCVSLPFCIVSAYY
jgi:hypothetical protein